MITALQRWGNSQGIRIPSSILKEINVVPGQPMEISVTNDQNIIIKKVSQRKTIKELFDGYEGTYNMAEIDWGTPQGKEIW